MPKQTTFLACPEFRDAQGIERCGLPAEVLDRYCMESTDGRIASVRILCPAGHWFNGAVASLGLLPPADTRPGAATAATQQDLAVRVVRAGAGSPAHTPR